jgi:hypothetical protein
MSVERWTLNAEERSSPSPVLSASSECDVTRLLLILLSPLLALVVASLPLVMPPLKMTKAAPKKDLRAFFGATPTKNFQTSAGTSSQPSSTPAKARDCPLRRSHAKLILKLQVGANEGSAACIGHRNQCVRARNVSEIELNAWFVGDDESQFVSILFDNFTQT